MDSQQHSAGQALATPSPQRAGTRGRTGSPPFLNHDQRRRIRKVKWGYVLQRVIRARLPLRCQWTIGALKKRHQAIKTVRIYAGDELLARMVGCSASSIYRGKKDLEVLHMVAVMHTVGGSTRNNDGKVVAAATGYEIHPDMLELADEDRQARSPQPVVQQRMQQLHEQWRQQAARGRAGP